MKQQVEKIQLLHELESEIDRINNQIKRTVQINKKQLLARERYALEQRLKQQVEKIQLLHELESEIDRINNQIKRTVQINKKQLLARERYALEQRLAKAKGE